MEGHWTTPPPGTWAWAGWIATLVGFAVAVHVALAQPPEGRITVRVTGAQHTDGRVGCSLWKSDEGWPTERRRAWASLWRPIRETTATCVFEGVPPGTYAVSVMHDEDGNGELARSLVGFPREGWGVSKNVSLRPLGPPRFDDASFRFDGTRIAIRIRLNY